MASAIRVRVRGPEGMTTITIDSDAVWKDLLKEISEKTGVPNFDLKYGYPPQPFNTQSISPDTKLSSLPHRLNGEQLILTPISLQDKLSSPMASTIRAPETVKALPPRELVSPPAHRPGDFPQAQPRDSPAANPLNLTRRPPPFDPSTEPPEVPLPLLDGALVLRVMPDDNSCLFRALSSAVLGSSLDGMTELRSIVAQTIRDQPELYSAAVLEKEPEDYCRWIQREDSWGGGIEIAILSQHFDVEVCSVNVQDLRVDRFNEGVGRRCVLVYSGIHYDVCAAAPYAGADLELDRKVFDVVRTEGEEIDGGVLEAAKELCRGLREKRYYTDTKGFALRCNVCGERGNGEQWARKHADATGHGDFDEGE